jgi:hypothetical protein
VVTETFDRLRNHERPKYGPVEQRSGWFYDSAPHSDEHRQRAEASTNAGQRQAADQASDYCDYDRKDSCGGL